MTAITPTLYRYLNFMDRSSSLGPTYRELIREIHERLNDPSIDDAFSLTYDAATDKILLETASLSDDTVDCELDRKQLDDMIIEYHKRLTA